MSRREKAALPRGDPATSLEFIILYEERIEQASAEKPERERERLFIGAYVVVALIKSACVESPGKPAGHDRVAGLTRVRLHNP